MKTSRFRSHLRASAAFTLLELMVVMFIMTLLLTAIFGIVQGTVQLTSEMSAEQEKSARLRGFTQLCERTFRNLPAQSTVRLRVKQSGNRYLSQLALKDIPVAFSPSGAGTTGLTVLETEEAPNGYLRIVLKWLLPEEVAAWERGESDGGQNKLVLLENVAVCEWKFYNPRSAEWEPVWNDKVSLAPPATSPDEAQSSQSTGPLGQRPTLIEMRLGIGADEVQRLVLWTPPGEAPAGLANNQPPPGRPPGPGGPEGPGTGDPGVSPVQIAPGTGQPPRR